MHVFEHDNSSYHQQDKPLPIYEYSSTYQQYKMSGYQCITWEDAEHTQISWRWLLSLMFLVIISCRWKWM